MQCDDCDKKVSGFNCYYCGSYNVSTTDKIVAGIRKPKKEDYK